VTEQRNERGTPARGGKDALPPHFVPTSGGPLTAKPIRMPPASRIASILLACLFAFPAFAQPSQQGNQIVAISFDGANDLAQWERSRALARRTGASFTYFVSCVFLLTRKDRDLYHPPRHRAGASNIGFAPSKEDVAWRLREIWTARLEGHDIASHGCGHFDAAKWSRKDWSAELGEVRTIFRDAWTVNDIPYEPAGWRAFVRSGIVGFRAPYLSTSPGLDAALAENGFLYSASGVSRGPQMPFERGGLVQFSLPTIPEGPSDRRVIAMDYNLYVRHSHGKEDVAHAAEYEERAYSAFQAAFQQQYDGERIPLEIGFHFTLMNGGAYWRALERFAAETCTRPDVECISYSDLARRIRAEDIGQPAPAN
jgi:peptidoglycan/xylan/chitin deacetylase (PgdA/CDA1 family)